MFEAVSGDRGQCLGLYQVIEASVWGCVSQTRPVCEAVSGDRDQCLGLCQVIEVSVWGCVR